MFGYLSTYADTSIWFGKYFVDAMNFVLDGYGLTDFAKGFKTLFGLIK